MEAFLDPSNVDESLTAPLDLQHCSCFYCNGFYGPCFGEPVCATCHEFLYPEDFEFFQRAVRCPTSFYGSEKDDGDSGNDEPSEEAGPSNNRVPLGAEANQNFPASPPLPSPGAEEEDIMEWADMPEQPVEQDPPPVPNGEVRNGCWDLVPLNAFPFPFPPPYPVIQLGSSNNRPSNRPQDRLHAKLALLTLPKAPYEAISSDDDMALKVPPEIWAAIFSKLDDISLALASKVNTKWKAIVLDQYPNTKWEEFVRLRWPIFNPVYEVDNWYQVYCDFLDSVPCKLCFVNVALHQPFDNFQPARSLRSVRLHKEVKWLRSDHPEGIEAVPLDNLNYNWLARISGPPDSPYQGGVFYLNLKIPHDYPLKPPVVRFLTRIIHPNVSRHGDIGIDCIQHNWTLALTIPQILLSVQSLLTDPYLETNMEPAVAHLYAQDRPAYDKIARVWTWKYAMHDVLVH